MEIKMRFDVNQTEFQTGYHKSIWHRGISVLPLEITLNGISAPETREGFTQIYNFTLELLWDMYNNSDRYSDLSFLHIHRDYAIEHFFRTVGGWAASKEFDDSGLCLKMIIKDDEALKKFYLVLSLLEAFGFSCSNQNEYKVLGNNKYPLLLKYMSIFYSAAYLMTAKAPAKRAGLIQNCDFRVFSRVKPQGIEDLLYTLPDKSRAFYQELHNYVTEKGAKKESGFYRYKYKNEHIVSFDYKPSIFISYKLKTGNSMDKFITELIKQPDKNNLLDYIKNETTICYHCGLSTCKTYVEYFICTPRGRVRHPHFNRHNDKIRFNEVELQPGCRYHLDDVTQSFNEDEIKILKRLIDVRFAQITNL